MTDVTSALEVIQSALPPEIQTQQIQERILNLAASGNALALDLGVENISDEQKQAATDQILKIAAEINRLQTLIQDND